MSKDGNGDRQSDATKWGDKVIREARALPVNFSDQAPNVKLNLKTAIETTNAHE